MKVDRRRMIGGTLMLAAGAAMAQDRTAVTLGTATPGGGFPVYGAAYAATINAMDPTLDIRPVNTRGSTENAPLIEAGKIDIAQATGEVTYEAIAGIGQPPAQNIRIINAMYSQSGMFIVRADSPYKTIADLKGRPIAWGAKGSGFLVLARYLMGGLGLDLDKDFQAVYLDKAAEGPQMVLDGRAAAMWGGGIGWPSFDTIAKGPHGARFIAPDAAEMQKIVASFSFLKPVTLPAGSYPGQNVAVTSLGSWPFVLARASLPDDVAYRLARALHKGEAMLGARLAQAKESTLANTLAAAPRQDLIHPGVLRYMREIGLVKPEAR